MILVIIFIGLLGIAALSLRLWWHFINKKRPIPEDTKATANKIKEGQIETKILLQAVADGVLVTDTSGKINLINPAAAELLGWPSNEATKLDVHSVVKLSQVNGKPLPEGSYPFDEVMRSKQAAKATLQLMPRGGSQKVISLVISPIVLPPDYELVGAVAVMRDISHQHQEEVQRGEFISTASHEMRTPVAAIEGYLALALNPQVGTIDSRARSYLEKAHLSTKHLGKLFQDLLTSARAEDGRLINHPVIIEMGDYLEQIAQDMHFAAEKKGLRMEFVTNSGESMAAINAGSKIIHPLYYVHADPDRLREVVTNLLDNAIKYTEKGKISIGLTGDNEVVQFFVRDTGTGILAEDIPHLFQKFYRINSGLTRTVGGTGLGLFISRKIMELYNGSLWVDSQAGKGSTFYVNLPRVSSRKVAELQAAQSEKTLVNLPPPAKVA